MSTITNDKLTIKELAKHYIHHYDLNTKNSSSSNPYADDGLAKYIQAITRIIFRVCEANENFRDIIDEEGRVRQISILDFEMNCFPLWAQYIDKNCKPYKAKALKKDAERYEKNTNDLYWKERIDTTITTHYNASQDDYYDIESEDSRFPNPYFVSPNDFERKCNSMMLEAIYTVFFKSFKRDLLLHDMKNLSYLQSIDPDDISKELLDSADRLKDFSNYIGELR